MPATRLEALTGIERGRRPAGRGLLIAVAFALVASGGCSIAGGTLGGRERCLPDTERRQASLWRGILRIDASGGRLEMPEGDVIPLLPGTLTPRVGADGGQLVRGNDVVARAGDDITLFDGAASDGALVVCAVEEVHGDTS